MRFERERVNRVLVKLARGHAAHDGVTPLHRAHGGEAFLIVNTRQILPGLLTVHKPSLLTRLEIHPQAFPQERIAQQCSIKASALCVRHILPFHCVWTAVRDLKSVLILFSLGSE